MKKQVILFICIVLVGGMVIAGWLFLGRGDKESKDSRMDAALLGEPRQVIHMTNNGFEPAGFEIHAGDIVQWVNNDTADHWPASDLHPTHGIYPEFDPQTPIPPGESWSFRFDKEGNWRFHDHLKPLFRGVVKVLPQ